MEMARLGTALASIVSIMPPSRRSNIEPIPLLETGYEERTDEEALWSDFMAVGMDMRVAMRKHEQSIIRE
tara:strand:- start:1 stop:210 length:210 start_codon:yes stop_codon:yes gene_type:complete